MRVSGNSYKVWRDKKTAKLMLLSSAFLVLAFLACKFFPPFQHENLHSRWEKSPAFALLKMFNSVSLIDFVRGEEESRGWTWITFFGWTATRMVSDDGWTMKYCRLGSGNLCLLSTPIRYCRCVMRSSGYFVASNHSSRPHEPATLDFLPTVFLPIQWNRGQNIASWFSSAWPGTTFWFKPPPWVLQKQDVKVCGKSTMKISVVCSGTNYKKLQDLFCTTQQIWMFLAGFLVLARRTVNKLKGVVLEKESRFFLKKSPGNLPVNLVLCQSIKSRQLFWAGEGCNCVEDTIPEWNAWVLWVNPMWFTFMNIFLYGMQHFFRLLYFRSKIPSGWKIWMAHWDLRFFVHPSWE